MAKKIVKKSEKTYEVNVILPHKYLKYLTHSLKDNIKTLREALKFAGKFVGNTIADSERFVKRKGIDGPYIITVSETDSIDSFCHIEFFIKKGAFDWKMSKLESIVAEEWFESGPRAAEAAIKYHTEKRKK